ncbi:MAG: hypothetical protein OXC12_13900 [Spirochaetaceae bacterium]|nr:hypothetical protein [Spirochaetaceae bacterium]
MKVRLLDDADLRAYAHRDWAAPARLARRERVCLPVARKVQLAVQLYEAARAARPGWPDEETRRSDLATHRRVRALLDRAAHVGCR